MDTPLHKNVWNGEMSPQSLSPAGCSSPVSDLTLLFYSLHCQETNTPWRYLKPTPESHSPPGAQRTHKRPPQLETPTVRNSIKHAASRERLSPGYSAPKLKCVRVKLSSRFPNPVNRGVSLAKEQCNTSPAEVTLSQENEETMETEDDMAFLSLSRLRSRHHPNQTQILEPWAENHLIGDFSKMHALPIKQVDQDLYCVSANTVASLLNGEFKSTVEDFLVIDCRYPYEYLGGHIKGAVNLHTEAQVQKAFRHGLALGPLSPSAEPESMAPHVGSVFGVPCVSPGGEEQSSSSPETLPVPIPPLQSQSPRKLLIFHCELSSERGPRLCKYLRRLDRNLHSGVYPHLYHPEVYLLHGGYKHFFLCFPDLCEPRGYVPMRHLDFREQLKGFRQKRKTARQRQRLLFKPHESTYST